MSELPNELKHEICMTCAYWGGDPDTGSGITMGFADCLHEDLSTPDRTRMSFGCLKWEMYKGTEPKETHGP